jgi:hypothetical protein
MKYQAKFCRPAPHQHRSNSQGGPDPHLTATRLLAPPLLSATSRHSASQPLLRPGPAPAARLTRPRPPHRQPGVTHFPRHHDRLRPAQPNSPANPRANASHSGAPAQRQPHHRPRSRPSAAPRSPPQLTLAAPTTPPSAPLTPAPLRHARHPNRDRSRSSPSRPARARARLPGLWFGLVLTLRLGL